LQYDFWKSPKINAKADIVVPPHKFSDFEHIAENLGMKVVVIIENLQR
jgi:FtsZ-interacting cell division protein YlmF